MKLIINTLLIILVAHYILQEINRYIELTLPMNKLNIFKSSRKQEHYVNKQNTKQQMESYINTSVSAIPHQDNHKSNNDVANIERNFNNQSRAGTGDYKIDRYYEPGIGGIKEGNYYTTDYNTPNFESNIMPTPAYFKQFEQTVEPFISVKEQTTPQKPCYYDTKSDAVAPSQWIYKDERTMNGGIIFGNVTGFDTLHSDYSLYDTLGKYGCDKQTFDHSLKKDDIRAGLGIPNQYYRDTN
jgi:hypothetical protein